MSLNLFSLYDALPDTFKKPATHAYIALRLGREYCARHTVRRLPLRTLPRMVFLSGVHRSGTSVLKAFFSDYPGLDNLPLDPRGFHCSWKRLGDRPTVGIDKSNHYLLRPRLIYDALGNNVAFCIIVRDPRDTLLSLNRWRESRNIARDESFWVKDWHAHYDAFFRFAAANAQHGLKAMLLRYEDLVRSPVAAKTFFLDWLGVPRTVAVSNTYTTDAQDRGVEPTAHQRREVDATSLEKWKGQTGDMADLLGSWRRHHLAAAMMSRLGYGEDGVQDVLTAPSGMTMFQPGGGTPAP